VSSGEGVSANRRGRFSTRAQIAAMTCACGGASLFLFAVNPNRYAVYPQCAFYHLTGLYCAGCGATRALYALLHGRVVEALHDNLLLMMALPLLLVLSGRYLAEAWRGNAWPKRDIPPRQVVAAAVAVFALMVTFMIARNLPGLPFDLLKPLAG
jgi:hypothetical protein